jgi:hypothetical protein
MREIYVKLKKCTLTPFVALEMRTEGNAAKNGEPSWLPLYDNASAHWPGLIEDFLANNNVTTVEQHLTWLQLIFTTFPRLNSALNGLHLVMLLAPLRMRRKS